MRIIINKLQYNYLLEQTIQGWSTSLPKNIKASDVIGGLNQSLKIGVDDLRNLLYSPEGISISVLSNFDPSGFSQSTVRILFLILLLDDIDQWINKGEPNWLYLICDSICLFSGGFTNSSIPRNLIKKGTSSTLSKTLEIIQKTNESFFEKILLPFIKKFENFVQFIKDFLKTYSNKITKIVSAVDSKLTSYINIIISYLEKVWNLVDQWMKSFLMTYGRYKTIQKSLEKFSETDPGKKTIKYLLPKINPLLGSDKLDPFILDLISNPNNTFNNLDSYNIDDYFIKM